MAAAFSYTKCVFQNCVCGLLLFATSLIRVSLTNSL